MRKNIFKKKENDKSNGIFVLESPILKPDKIESNERAIPRRSASFEESVLEESISAFSSSK